MGKERKVNNTTTAEIQSPYYFSDDLDGVKKNHTVNITKLRKAAEIVRKSLNEYEKENSLQQ